MATEVIVGESLLAMQLQAADVNRLIQETADFEFAFLMQLGEALIASADSATSGSSSTAMVDSGSGGSSSTMMVDSGSTGSWSTAMDVNIVENAMDDGEDARAGTVAADVAEDRQVAMTEQQQEMEKLKQEMEDEGEAWKEQSRLAEIEAITQHDARFAQFLSSVPEDRGENLADPFMYTPDQTYVGRSTTANPAVGNQEPMTGMQLGSEASSSSVICQRDMWEPAVAAAFLLDANNPDNKSYLATIKDGFHVDRMSWTTNTELRDVPSTPACGICMEAVMSPGNSLVVSDKCMHRFCTECLRKHAETVVKSGTSYVTCPEFLCEELWSAEMSQDLLSSNSALVLTQRQIEDAFPQAERVYCPFQDCSALQLKPELPNLPSSSGHPHETAVGGVECFSCSRYFCLECRVPWHSAFTCEEFQNLDERSGEDLYLKGLAKEKNWQRCNKCGFMVELLSGCHHISCRCGNEFCYICGDSWAHGHICKLKSPL